MRPLLILTITCLCLLFSGCAKSGDSSSSTSDSDAGAAGTGGSSKNLFSVWNEENNTFQLDFRSAQFGGSSTVYITSGTVGSCECQVTIQGSQTAGTMVFSSCTNGSIGCVSLKPTGSYTNSGAALQLCTSTSCINMH
jgi:hypothetical protein